MKRTKLQDRLLPSYTKGEERMNMISHIVGGGFGVIALATCVVKAFLVGNAYDIVGAFIYGFSMITLYTMSSLYHGLKSELAKKVFQVIDHCTIFILIAGTYTPIALVAAAAETDSYTPFAVALDKAAKEGDDTKYNLPRSKPGANPYDMSFSGLKTAALNLIHHAEQVGEELDIPSLCAAFTAAVSDTLVPRVELALKQTGHKKIAVAGGVAANSRIRADILAAAEKLGAEVFMPPLSLCGDNGAMIGAQAYYEYLAGNTAGMSLNAYATKSILGEAL